MGEVTDNLKAVAQIRKAIEPLASMISHETDSKLQKLDEQTDKRLASIEAALEALLKKDTSVEVKAPEVNVTVETPEAVTEALTKLQKSSEPKASTTSYEPHDQVKKGTFQYSGFVRSDGEWYIQRVAKGEQRYAKGAGSYSKAWDDVENLKYGYLDG